MDLITLDPPRDHLQTMIIDDVLKHLKSETDDRKKLRIALLLAINLLQAEDDFPACDLCDALLGYFPELADHFDSDNLHDLVGGYKCMRVKDENDHLKILIPNEYVEYLAGPYLDRGTG